MPYERTKLQQALLTSDAAWRWFLLGYEAGVAAGADAGAQDVVDQMKAAGAELAPWLADVRAAIDMKRERSAARPETQTDIAERRRRVAESWGLPVDGAA